jgi:hypothetical protein
MTKWQEIKFVAGELALLAALAVLTAAVFLPVFAPLAYLGAVMK